MTAPLHRALVLFPGALGDLLCCWPALDGLIASGLAVTLVAHSDWTAVLPPEGLRTASIDRREIADLFATGPLGSATRAFFAGFERVDSFTGAGDPQFAVRLAAASGRPAAVHAFRGMTAGEHAAAYYARCLGVAPRSRLLPLAGDAAAWSEALWQQHHLGRRVLAIHAGSGSRAKDWEGMTDIASGWRRSGGQVVSLVGPAEDERQATIPADAVVARESLARVAAVIRWADRYLGNDSGISHLAGLVGGVGVALFGDSDPAIWAPLGAGIRVLRSAATCDRCAADRFCIHRLAPVRVRAALR